jgi:hypothetical protein
MNRSNKEKIEIYPTEMITTVSRWSGVPRETLIYWCKNGKIEGAYNNGTWQIEKAALTKSPLKEKLPKWVVTNAG